MKCIAVVEDNADNRLLVQAVLGGEYELEEYVDGLDALAGMERRRPDLVLLDISLPVLDGEAVLRRIRGDARLRALPVIAFTAHTMRGDRERLLAAGFSDYLPKPVEDLSVLRGMVAKWLAS